jgi:hypothetical protein
MMVSAEKKEEEKTRRGNIEQHVHLLKVKVVHLLCVIPMNISIGMNEDVV